MTLVKFTMEYRFYNSEPKVVSVYLNPEHVSSVCEEGENQTNVHTTNGQFFALCEDAAHVVSKLGYVLDGTKKEETDDGQV